MSFFAIMLGSEDFIISKTVVEVVGDLIVCPCFRAFSTVWDWVVVILSMQSSSIMMQSRCGLPVAIVYVFM